MRRKRKRIGIQHAKQTKRVIQSVYQPNKQARIKHSLSRSNMMLLSLFLSSAWSIWLDPSTTETKSKPLSLSLSLSLVYSNCAEFYLKTRFVLPMIVVFRERQRGRHYVLVFVIFIFPLSAFPHRLFHHRVCLPFGPVCVCVFLSVCSGTNKISAASSSCT